MFILTLLKNRQRRYRTAATKIKAKDKDPCKLDSPYGHHPTNQQMTSGERSKPEAALRWRD